VTAHLHQLDTVAVRGHALHDRAKAVHEFSHRRASGPRARLGYREASGARPSGVRDVPRATRSGSASAVRRLGHRLGVRHRAPARRESRPAGPAPRSGRDPSLERRAAPAANPQAVTLGRRLLGIALEPAAVPVLSHEARRSSAVVAVIFMPQASPIVGGAATSTFRYTVASTRQAAENSGARPASSPFSF
jgi:hypothetical protein